MKNYILKAILFLLLSLSINILGFAGNSGHSEVNNNDFCFKKMRAWLRIKGNDYNGALRIYRQMYEIDKTDAVVNFRLGQCNLNLKNIDDAITYLTSAKELDPAVSKDLYLFLGQAYQAKGDIDKAIDEFYIYKSRIKYSDSKKLFVDDLLVQCFLAKELMANPVNVTVNNLGDAVNSQYDDALPVFSPDYKTMMFTSRRPNVQGEGIDPNTRFYYDDVYESQWDDSKGEWGVAKNAGEVINTAGYDAALSMTNDMLFIYRNISKKTKSGDIFYSKKQNGTWAEPQSILKPVNSGFFESSACLSADGKTLHFVSERRGGYGNADIYKSIKIVENIWEKPINLGNTINSEEDELGIFLTPDGKTLYFSSKGHKSMGGYDIFMSKYDGTKWSDPVNLGYPINTVDDEFNFVLSKDGKKAYVSSTRPNGKGGADIYEVDMSSYIPLSEIKKEAVIVDITKNEKYKELQNENVKLVQDKKDLEDANKDCKKKVDELAINLANMTKKSEDISKVDKNVKIGDKFEIPNIFFGSKEYNLTKESETGLDNLVSILKKNPGLKIEVAGHTDDVGSFEYNKELSEKRAKTVVDYLITKGVSKDRLAYKGYGFEKPIADNTTEEGKKRNRRTEIIIVDK